MIIEIEWVSLGCLINKLRPEVIVYAVWLLEVTRDNDWCVIQDAAVEFFPKMFGIVCSEDSIMECLFLATTAAKVKFLSS